MEFADSLCRFGFFAFAIFSGFSITGAQISLGLSLIGLVFLLYKKAVFPKTSPLDRPFFFFALAGVFSLANATNLFEGFRELSKFLILIVFCIPYWFNIDRPLQRKILGTMIAFSVISSVAGLIKLFFFDVKVDRAYGFFSIPITFGECHALFMLVTLSWLCAGEENRLSRFLLLISFFLQGAGLLASFTRGARIGFGLGFCGLAFQHPRKLLSIAVTILIACLLGAMFSGLVRERFKSFLISAQSISPENLKAEYRMRIWQIGMNVLENYPVFGVGMNNVKNWYKQYINPNDIKRKEVHGHLHNSFLQILVMTGFFGFLAFWWFLFETGRFCFLLHSGIADVWQASLAKGCIAFLFCFMGTGLTEYSFGDEEVAMLFFFLTGVFASPFRGISANRG